MNKSKVTLFFLINLLTFFYQAIANEIDITTYSHSLLNVGAGQPSISVCDFNSDGNLDVIVSNYSDNNIITFKGNGNGDLLEVGRFPVGENPTSIAVSDINDDENIDVAIANHETSFITLLFGDGKGNFKTTSHSVFKTDLSPHPHLVRLEDLDGDSKVDLIVDSRTHNGLRFYKGQANGRFESPSKLINTGGDPYRGFAINHINADELLDIVTPNQREIGIVTNTSSDKLSFTLKMLAPYDAPFAVELAEMNGDGKIDLIVASNDSSITIIPGDGDGNFREENKTEIKTATGAKQIAIGDINGDGLKDALVSNWSGELYAVFGGKAKIEASSFKLSSIPNPWGVALADLNEDGKSDLIIADGNTKLASVYISKKE
jgi:hypothetical protein